MNASGKPASSTDQRYYEHAGKIKLARRISSLARRRVYDLFLRTMKPAAGDRILDIGATDDAGIESNMLEQLYPHRENITCVGLTDGQSILATYPGVRHVRMALGERLPFGDAAFDIVYSNAVLEHVGSRERQKEFIAEMCRLAPRRFLAVPNRSFPIEHHTGLPLVHHLPPETFRKLLRGSRYDLWSREENLNYISAAEISALWPGGNSPSVAYSGVGFGRWKSNLVVYQA
jgi:2-polyprenyl-3-methyl-5-hydroxy-6-metoxy-1,4-benzoquinol methylase